MFKRIFLAAFLMGLLWSATSAQGEIVVLGETPVAEFALPDGSVLKNAFVWRRSSEGLMIVHDDGQFFLNFAVLPSDWRAVYLGEAAAQVEEPEPEQPLYETYDPCNLMPILSKAPGLTETGRTFVLRKGGDEDAEKQALALGVLQSLLSGEVDAAKRLMLIIEEKGLEIESVERDALFVECATCEGTGRRELNCSVCLGTGKCPKCSGTGERDTGLKTTVYCTTCRGKGACRECGGEGSKSSVCRVCRGRGRLLEKRYCEIKRDFYVHIINQSARPDVPISVTQSDRDRFVGILKTLPELEGGAAEFYASDAYTGGVDTNILVACTMQSLLRGKMDDAEWFYTTVEVHYGEGRVLEMKNYLKPCDVCDGSGAAERDCRSCKGTGKCVRCGGDGERDSEFLDRTTPCTTCRGNGKCADCGGPGKIKIRCGACEGTGRDFDKDRTQIKLQLEVEELNRFFLDHK